jgi:transposase InsO family protein
MPWQPRDLMETKKDFIALAIQEGSNRRELCRRFGITPKAGYALLARYAHEGEAALQPRSRRPRSSPGQTEVEVVQAVLLVRARHPSWGGRKIARWLLDHGHERVPAPSTITSILRRHGLLDARLCDQNTAWQRFEHEHPNALWQIDFKGHFDTAQARCHPLTLLDDHSRFNLLLHACQNVRTDSVQPQLERAFEQYGLPVRINADNGAPWGSPSQAEHGLSELTVWLIRLGIRVSHSSPYHPQTNGKLERFHRSLKLEALAGKAFVDLPEVQRALNRWREIYNHERPHDALGLATPASRYAASTRSMPARLTAIEYPPDDEVHLVRWNGQVAWRGMRLKVSNALHRLPIAFRPDPHNDGSFDVYFCHHRFMRIDMLNEATDKNPG